MLRRGQKQTKGQAKEHNKEPKPTKTAKLNEREEKVEKQKQPIPSTKTNPATTNRGHRASEKTQQQQKHPGARENNTAEVLTHKASSRIPRPLIENAWGDFKSNRTPFPR
ncbi:hypothetical protein QL285_046927 [Trifolium repens]|nr:hypothetical protein QL285_046927 [Trifolium repens]